MSIRESFTEQAYDLLEELTVEWHGALWLTPAEMVGRLSKASQLATEILLGDGPKAAPDA